MMKKRKAEVCAANPEPREEEFVICCGGIQPNGQDSSLKLYQSW